MQPNNNNINNHICVVQNKRSSDAVYFSMFDMVSPVSAKSFHLPFVSLFLYPAVSYYHHNDHARPGYILVIYSLLVITDDQTFWDIIRSIFASETLLLSCLLTLYVQIWEKIVRLMVTENLTLTYTNCMCVYVGMWNCNDWLQFSL